MTDTTRVTAAIFAHAPLLITESKDDFAHVCETLRAEIDPHGTIEQMYVAEVAHSVWEIRRLARCKIAIINSSFRSALQNIITQMLRQPASLDLAVKGHAETLAHSWFVDPTSKKEIADLLNKFGLDESAIEAEAMRQAADDLERIDRLMRFAQTTRDRALVYIGQYRGSFGDQLRKSSAKMIGRENVVTPSLPKQRPAA
jgi:hypothetical protein